MTPEHPRAETTLIERFVIMINSVYLEEYVGLASRKVIILSSGGITTRVVVLSYME